MTWHTRFSRTFHRFYSHHQPYLATTAVAATSLLVFVHPSIPENGKTATITITACEENKTSSTSQAAGDELFQGQCLERQRYKPKVPYPAWDYNWDGKMTDDTSLEGHRAGRDEASTDNFKTRHILLVRHGQYDERYSDDKLRKLTPLGRIQAVKTGQRLAEIAQGTMEFRATKDVNRWYCGPVPITTIRVSNMTRAKETAEYIIQELNKQQKQTAAMLQIIPPDPKLNEALPAPMIPIRADIPNAEAEIDANHERMEAAFQKYFYRDTSPDNKSSSNNNNNPHEFEIIVCHANVIRYFFCRALQLPPEAWLRMSIFNCSLTYLIIRPNGTVSARMLGDIGHLDYKESTFSGYYGFKW